MAAHADTVAAGRVDERDWPHTTRVLPWLVALMIGVLFLTPIDSLTLPVPLPFDARPDRIMLMLCFGVWLLVVAVEAPVRVPRLKYRFGALEVLLVGLVLVAVGSVALNLSVLERLDEASTATKKLVLLGSYIGFYLFIVGNVRASEVPAFVRLVIALGVVVALGTTVEYFTHFNIFFTAANKLTLFGAKIQSHSSILTAGGRPDVTGPARHGLATSTMLSMILPLALVGAGMASERRGRILFGIAAAIIFIGSVSTLRRSGLVLPFVGCSLVLIVGGRRMRPVAVATLAALALVPVVAPSVVQDVGEQFSASNVSAQQSIQGRRADYPAVVPDLRAGALVGRGFGSYSSDRYRTIDNEYILSTIETGFIGVAVYAAVILTAAGIALRTGLRRHGPRPWIALAAAGSMLAFLAANALFDALSFPHAPYAFFLIAGLVGVARQPERADALEAP